MTTDRRNLVQAALAKAELGGILAFRPEELVMLAGYYPHHGMSVAWVPLEGYPVMFVPAFEPELPPLEGWNIVSYPKESSWKSLLDGLAKEIAHQRAGFRKDSSSTAPPTNAAEAPALSSETFSSLRLEPSDAVFEELLSIKTSEDMPGIRLANQVALEGVQVFRMQLVEGRTEAQVAAAVEQKVHEQTGRKGISSARAWATVQSGTNTIHAGTYSRTSHRTLALRDTVLLEIATCVNGYWSDLTRTVSVGDPTELLQRAAIAVHDAQKSATNKIRPGVLAEEIDLAARQALDKYGLEKYFSHATGHPVGFRYHDTGPVLARGNRTPLRAGMVLTIEPGVYSEELGGGYRHEENILVTDSGMEILSLEK